MSDSKAKTGKAQDESGCHARKQRGSQGTVRTCSEGTGHGPTGTLGPVWDGLNIKINNNADYNPLKKIKIREFILI